MMGKGWITSHISFFCFFLFTKTISVHSNVYDLEDWQILQKVIPLVTFTNLGTKVLRQRKIKSIITKTSQYEMNKKKKIVNNEHRKSKYFCHSFAHIVCSIIKHAVPKVNILFSLIFQLLENSICIGWCTNTFEYVAKGVFSNASPFYILNNILLNFLLTIKVCFLLFPPFSCLLETELQLKRMIIVQPNSNTAQNQGHSHI